MAKQPIGLGGFVVLWPWGPYGLDDFGGLVALQHEPHFCREFRASGLVPPSVGARPPPRHLLLGVRVLCVCKKD